jgi:hypothetical protein
MRYATIIVTVIALSLTVMLFGCKSDPAAATMGEGVISGYITDGSSKAPLAGVEATAMSVGGSSSSTTSDANGMYTFKFSVDSTMNVTITMKKTGYRDSSFVAQLKSGLVITKDFVMTPVSIVGGGSTGGTGKAQTIFFVGPQGGEVQVYGVGGKETTILSWEVRDSLGLPIGDAHAVDLAFNIFSGPNGGEYVSPVVVKTNSTGQAHMTFNAGVKAGVAQIVASTTVDGRTITSGPVKVIITGGFPDQAHFTLAPLHHNFPSLGIAGMRLPISVLIGDKYSNPCSPSAVYFNTSAGVIQGGFQAVVTSKDGQGTVDLISGNPLPMGQYAAADWGNGYHRVYARTIGEGGRSVQDSVVILWSGPGIVSNVSPTSFNVPDGGSQTITFRVSDVNGNPLAAGTRIAVIGTVPPPTSEGAKQNQISVLFGNNGAVELPDVLQGGPGITEFSILIRDGSTDYEDIAGTAANVSIVVTGPNTPNQTGVTVPGVLH